MQDGGMELSGMLVLLRHGSLGGMLAYVLPAMRVERSTRSAIEHLHLHGSTWGHECSICDRRGGNQRTFTWVRNDENGEPMVHLCYICHNGDWPR